MTIPTKFGGIPKAATSDDQDLSFIDPNLRFYDLFELLE